MATTKDQQDPKLNEPLAAYQRREADAMTDEEFEEALNKIPFQRIPGLAYTHEERMAELNEAMERHLRGESDMMDHDAFIKEMDEEYNFQRIPGLPYTHEERIAELEIAEAEHKLGLHISSEELEEEMKTW